MKLSINYQKYILALFLLFVGCSLIFYGTVKKIERIDNESKIKFIEASWIGQGNSRYYSYNYKLLKNGKAFIVTSRKKINPPFYVIELKSNIYLKQKYDFDRIYYVVSSPYIWRTLRIILGVVFVILCVFTIRKKKPCAGEVGEANFDC